MRNESSVVNRTILSGLKGSGRVWRQDGSVWFEQELENGDIEFREFIDKIQHYTATIDGFVGLEPRLTEADFGNYIDWAQQMKEYYYKKLQRIIYPKQLKRFTPFYAVKNLFE